MKAKKLEVICVFDEDGPELQKVIMDSFAVFLKKKLAEGTGECGEI